VVGATGWSVLEWLTMTGWKVELGGEPGAVFGAARKPWRGELLEVRGKGETVEAVGWALVDRAATALERRDDQSVAAAA